jgi:spermidine synthase
MHDDASHTAIIVSVIPPDPFPIDTGVARFEQRGESVTLYLNGVPSSQWSVTDPSDLEFEYMRWMLQAVRAAFPEAAALRALHLGAAACSLPRAIVHAFPQSRHLAVEVDAALARAIRRHVPLPRSPVLRIRVADAVPTLHARPPASHHLIVRDAFDHALATPAGLTNGDAAAAVATALRSDGLYLANCADTAGLPAARREVKTLAGQFAHVGLITEPALLRGRRLGNVVLLARHEPFSAAQTASLDRALRAGGFPARLLAGQEALRWAGLG